MKIIHKELFTFTPNDSITKAKSKIKADDLKNCGYRVSIQTNITGITVIGSKTIHCDSLGNELHHSGECPKGV